MEKYDFCGLKVPCPRGCHNEYMNVKNEFENAVSEAMSPFNMGDYKGRITVYGRPMDNTKMLTFIMHGRNNGFKIGIYNKKTETISEECTLEDMKNFVNNREEFSRFTAAIRNYSDYKNLQNHRVVNPRIGKAWVKNIIDEQIKKIEESQKKHHISKETREETNQLLIELYYRDRITHGHSIRVGHLVHEFWLNRGADPYTAEEYKIGALLHDIGKLHTPNNVLKKPGKLTKDEFLIIQDHAKNGLDCISNELKESDIVRDSILYHHEAYEGDRGYPDKNMHGRDIPEAARVLAVFDVFDALSSKRQYKEPMAQKDVLRIMKDDPKLDPDIVKEVDAFMKEREDRGQLMNDIPMEKESKELTKNLPEKAMALEAPQKFRVISNEGLREQQIQVRDSEPERVIKAGGPTITSKQMDSILEKVKVQEYQDKSNEEYNEYAENYNERNRELERAYKYPEKVEIMFSGKAEVEPEQDIEAGNVVYTEKDREELEYMLEDLWEKANGGSPLAQENYKERMGSLCEEAKAGSPLAKEVVEEQIETLWDKARNGDQLAIDIFEDFYMSDMFSLGFEDKEEKIEKGPENETMDDVMKNAKDRAKEAKAEKTPVQNTPDREGYDDRERVLC